MAQAKNPYRSPDTIFSDDTLEVILGLGEGPYKGLTDGGKSAYFGDTPLLDSVGRPNVANFDLKVYKGSNPGEVIKPNLGGTGSATSVGVALTEMDQAVTRRGTKTNLDFIDVRLNLNALRYVDIKGNDFPAYMHLYVQVKRMSQSWEDAMTVGLGPSNSDTSVKTSIRTQADVGNVKNSAYTEVYAQPSAPTGVGLGALWFKTDATNGSPKIWNSASWVNPPSLVGTSFGAFYKWTFTDYQNTIRTAYWSPTGSVPSVELNPLDMLISPTGVSSGVTTPQSFVWNGSAFVDSLSWSTPPVVASGVQTVYGHITASTGKTYRIQVPRINEVFDVRVIRKTQKSDQYYTCEYTWESFHELTVEPQQYNDLSLAHLTIRASEQFTSLPEFTFDIQGRIIRVPTNFNEVTKVYSGVWDGLFKNAYTDDLAWIAYDLVMNTRYGMNAYYPCVLDKWDTYKFSQHCIQNGLTFNEYITEPRNLKEMVDYVVGVAGGRFIDRMDGYSTILFDADDVPAVAQFSAENIVDGLVTYSFTDITERKNDFTVSFINPELNWQEDRLRVYSQDAINAYGRNPEEFIAVGCINEAEAVRRGRYRLATSLTEKTSISFKTNRMGLYIEPYDVILFADPEMGDGISGRIKDVISPTQLTLRDEIYLESGFTYKIVFQIPFAGKYNLIEKTISPASGLVTTLNLTSALGVTLPENAQFTISQADKVGIPKAYRVETIAEVDGDPDNVSITAMEINRLKWSYVRGEVTLRDLISIKTGNTFGFVLPVTNLRVIPQSNESNTQNLVLAWSPTETVPILGYRVYAQVDAGIREVIGDLLPDTTMTIYNVAPSTYTFTVVAVGMKGQESPPVSVIHVVAGGLGSLSVVRPVSDLAIADEPVAGVFNNISPKFTWSPSPSDYVTGYQIQILRTSDLSVVRTEVVTEREYTYTYEANLKDFANSPNRSFIFSVRAQNIDKALSSPVQMSASNPVPAAPSVTIEPAFGSITVRTGAPSDKDYAGTIVWVSTTSGFNPLTTTPIYDGVGTEATFKATADVTYYVRVATYDSFGKTGLNISPQQATQTIKIKGLDLEAFTIEKDNLKANIIDATKLAATLQGIQVFATVPSTYQGDYATVGTPGVLYRWNGTAYVKAIDASQLSGMITSDQIESVNRAKIAGKLTNDQLELINLATAVTGQLSKENILSVNAASIQGTIVGTQIAAGALDATKFASSIKFNEVIEGSTLPTTGNTEGRKVYLTGTGRSYTYSSGAWKDDSAAANISGTITNAQIASVSATKLTEQITGVQISNNAITAAKIAAGEIIAGKLAAGAVTAGTIAAGAVTAGTIAALAVSTDNLQALSITAGKIAVGAVGADQIAAQSISAKHLVVADTQNLILDGDFAKGLDEWTRRGNGGTYTSTGGLAGPATTGAMLTKTSSNECSISSGVGGSFDTDSNLKAGSTIRNGEQVYLEVWLYGSSSSVAGQIEILQRTTAGNVFSLGNTAQIMTGGWIKLVITGTAVADGRVYIRILNTSAAGQILYATGVRFLRKNAGLLIVDGTILTNHLGAGSVMATNIGAGQVVAGKLAADSVSAANLQAGSIIAGKIAAGAVTAGTIAANAVTAGTVAANAISAANISAGAITAGKLALADTSNMLNNPTFSNPLTNTPSFEGWFMPADTTYDQPGAGDTGGLVRLVNSNGYRVGIAQTTHVISANPNDVFYAGAQVYNSRNSGSNASVVVYFCNSVGSIIGTSFNTTTLLGQWVDLNFRTTNAPAGTTSIVFSLQGDLGNSGTIFFGRPVLRRAMTALMIVQGAIITEHMTAGSISADRLIANSITAAQISAGAIGATQIAAGAIITDKIGIGVSDNLLYNSSFLAPITGYLQGPSGGSNWAGDVIKKTDYSGAYCPLGMGALRIYNTGNPGYNYYTVYLSTPMADGTYSYRYPITAGQWYEASIYTACNRCNTRMDVFWRDDAGNNIGTSMSNTRGGTGVEETLTVLSESQRLVLKAQAPAGATNAVIVVYLIANNANLPHLFATGALFGKAKPNQTEWTAWGDYGTIINGQGIAANSITAYNIAADSITGNKIAAASIQAYHIIAGSITADRLNVASLSAISANLGTITAGSISFPAGSPSFIEMWDYT